MTPQEIEHNRQVTQQGNPGNPQGDAGYEMLERMGRSHFEVTGWGIGFADLQPEDRILDIGCGGGAALKRMAERISEGHLTGLDHSAVSVQAASSLNKEAIASGKMDVLEGSVEAMPFPDESFDKIVTIESFYFWPSPEESLKEVYRVLREGGRFLLICDIYQKEGLSKEALANIEQYRLTVLTPEAYRKILEKAGFTDVKVHLKENTDWICVEGNKTSQKKEMLHTERLLENLVEQIKEAQLKLGYVKETIRLYFPVSSLCNLLGTECENGGELVKKLEQGWKHTELGAVTFSLCRDSRVEVCTPPVGAAYVKECVPDPPFLSSIIALFQSSPGLTIEEICACFARFSDSYVCEKMAPGTDFDYVLYFPEQKPDAWYYCVRIEMGHTIYHRFTEADYRALTV